jgi:hypothetical protein
LQTLQFSQFGSVVQKREQMAYGTAILQTLSVQLLDFKTAHFKRLGGLAPKLSKIVQKLVVLSAWAPKRLKWAVLKSNN